MPRFQSTYSQHYIAPPCEESEIPAVNFPGDNCKKCSRPCKCCLLPSPAPEEDSAQSPGSPCCSGCSGGCSTSSCVRSIKQVDFAAVPQIRNCRCQCRCCSSQSPERLPPVKTGPISAQSPDSCIDQCCPRKREDPCCRLHKVRTAQLIALDPNCYEPKCRCKPRVCKACPPQECSCCRIREDDPLLRHAAAPLQGPIKRGRTLIPGYEVANGNDLGSCSRNSSRPRFILDANSENSM